MGELLTLLKETSVSLIALVLSLTIISYFARSFIEDWFKGRFANLENLLKTSLSIKETSLSIKESLRDQEQKELVEFRVAVEEWEYFLLTGIANVTMNAKSPDFKPAKFHNRDIDLFGAVRIAVVKASIYLRDPQLEAELLKTISAIRGMYYPLLAGAIQHILELQGEILPYMTRMNQFEASGLKDTAVALTADEARIVVDLRHKMSAELRGYAEGLVARYKPIAEQLYELKEKINVHIYRPLSSHEIDKR